MEEGTIDLHKGAEVGAWKIGTPLGRGGQGGVWAVRAARTKHVPPRALKACFASDEQARARFSREVEILRSCESPFILKVYDHDLDWEEHVPGVAPFAYYVSEKCAGSMEQRHADLGDGRARLLMFRQACAAITYLHSLPDPVIHRDIKPANFLIAQELRNVVLADFGVPRSLALGTLTEAFEVVGTPYYRAPEVLHGQRGTVESDVYSAGRVLEWLLTNEVSTDMGARPVPRGGDLGDDACEVLDRVIAKATHITPLYRYKSVQELVDQLPELWLSVRPRAAARPEVGSNDAAAVLQTALGLARTNDQLGWRQLENQLRRDLGESLHRWRREREPLWRMDGNKELSFSTTDSLLDVAMGRIVFVLAGVFSTNPSLADQRPVVEDLLNVPGWNLGGTTAIAEAPRALLFLVHYLHGALCLAYGQPEIALRFAQVSIPDSQRNTSAPLWVDGELTGVAKLLGGRTTSSLEYLRSLRQRRPMLEEFFALQTDFDVGLTAYSMLLSLKELATDAASLQRVGVPDARNLVLEVPPLFGGMPADTIAAASRRTFGNRDVVERVAAGAGAQPAKMREMWPQWRQLIANFRRDAFNQYFQTDLLGDLA